MCWNCETKVALTQENCPSCCVYLSPITDADSQNNYNILIPPYRVQEMEESKASESISNQDSEEELAPKAKKKSDPDSIKFILLTIGLLFLGSIFVLFSSLLLIFSQNGTLTLQWSASYWYIYLGLAFPLLFLGWRGLDSITD